MKSYELLRAAATLILEGGWAPGKRDQLIDAADVDGNSVPLMVTGSTETGRASPNPAAVRFSAYGAIVAALHQGGGRLEDPAAMWALLAKRASEINGVAHGGNNFVHPLHQLNATEGMTAEKVLDFLGYCANEMEGVNRAIETVSRAIPRMTEPAPFPGVALGPHPAFPEPKVDRDPGAVAEPVQIARALKAAVAPEKATWVLPPGLQPQEPGTLAPLTQAEVASRLNAPAPYKPMLTPRRTLREEHPSALYSGPELNVTRVGPNPFGGDDEV